MSRIWGIIVIIIDVLAVLDVLKSNKETEKKILWIAIIILVPLFGAVMWYVVSRKIINF